MTIEALTAQEENAEADKLICSLQNGVGGLANTRMCYMCFDDVDEAANPLVSTHYYKPQFGLANACFIGMHYCETFLRSLLVDVVTCASQAVIKIEKYNIDRSEYGVVFMIFFSIFSIFGYIARTDNAAARLLKTTRHAH